MKQIYFPLPFTQCLLQPVSSILLTVTISIKCACVSKSHSLEKI